MSSNTVFKVPQYRIKIKKSNSDDKTINVRWEIVPEHRQEEFVNFLIKYYVRYEITHVAAGIHKQAEAVEEYRQILLSYHKNPLYLPLICCVDDEKSEIIAADNTILLRKGEIKKPIQGKTTEVKRFLEMVYAWDEIYSFQDVKALYNEDSLLCDMGFAVHPDYRGTGLTYTVAVIRELICKENRVPLTGTWITSLATKKACENAGCTKAFEITFEDLEKKLNIKFNNPPPTFIYFVKRIEF